MTTTYRVLYEQRTKPKCKCCTDEAHPWYEGSTEPTTDIKRLRNDESRVWDFDDPLHEVRNVRVVKADIDWQDVQSWELPDS